MAGIVKAAPALDVTSGMFGRPLARAALTRSFHPEVLVFRSPQVLLALMMMPARGGPPLLGEQDSVLAQPVARPVVLVEDDWVPLVDGQRPVESRIERLGAAGEQQRRGCRRRKVPRGQGDECVARFASPVTPRRGPAPATEAGARCAGSAWRMPRARGAPGHRGRPRPAIAPATPPAPPPDVRSGTCARAPRRAPARRGSPGWHSRIEHVAADRAPPRRTPGASAADGSAGASGAKAAAAPRSLRFRELHAPRRPSRPSRGSGALSGQSPTERSTERVAWT